MVLKDAFKILSSKSKLILKMALITFLILIVVLAIINSTLNAKLSGLYTEVKEANISEHIGKYLDTLSSDVENKKFIQDDIMKLKALFAKYQSSLRDLLILIIIYAVLIIFIVEVLSFNITAQYYEFMVADKVYKFFTLWIHYFKEAIQYALVRMLVGLPFLVLEWTLIIVFAIASFSVSFIFALAVAMWSFIILDALRITLFSQIAPIMLGQKYAPFKALVHNFKTTIKNFGSEFAYFVVLYVLAIPFILTISLSTFGLGLPFALTLSVLLFHIVPIIFAFRKNNKCYFVGPGSISKYTEEIQEI